MYIRTYMYMCMYCVHSSITSSVFAEGGWKMKDVQKFNNTHTYLCLFYKPAHMLYVCGCYTYVYARNKVRQIIRGFYKISSCYQKTFLSGVAYCMYTTTANQMMLANWFVLSSNLS